MTAYQLWERVQPGVPFGVWAETAEAQAAIAAERPQAETVPGATWSPDPPPPVLTPHEAAPAARSTP